jgi:hypothetical protein
MWHWHLMFFHLGLRPYWPKRRLRRAHRLPLLPFTRPPVPGRPCQLRPDAAAAEGGCSSRGGAAAAEGALQRPRGAAAAEGEVAAAEGELVPPKPLTWILLGPFRTESHYSQHRLLRGVTVDSGESFKQILKDSP